jgi:hypothetical protein
MKSGIKSVFIRLSSKSRALRPISGQFACPITLLPPYVVVARLKSRVAVHGCGAAGSTLVVVWFSKGWPENMVARLAKLLDGL